MPVRASQGGSLVKNPPANAGDARDGALIPEWGSSSRDGNGNPLPDFNPTDRGVWRATVSKGYKESDITEKLRTPNAGERIDTSVKQKIERRNRFTQIHSDN